MTQLLVRNLEPVLVNQLKNRAKLHHRSLQGEIKFILEKVAALPIEMFTDEIKEHPPEKWPNDFFEKIAGGWQGGSPIRHSQGKYEKREKFE